MRWFRAGRSLAAGGRYEESERVLARAAEGLFGRGKIDVTEPMLGGEDFACYLEKTPGAMFRLGVMNKKIKADQPWHSPEFIADEAALPVGTAHDGQHRLVLRGRDPVAAILPPAIEQAMAQ